MYNLIRQRGWVEALATEAPVIAISSLIAELFYKFHSFTLEAIAFLATWFIIGAASERVWKWTRSSRD